MGADFFRLPLEKQRFLLATGNMLFCRTEPKDKQRLVKMLQDMGEVGVHVAQCSRQSLKCDMNVFGLSWITFWLLKREVVETQTPVKGTCFAAKPNN